MAHIQHCAEYYIVVTVTLFCIYTFAIHIITFLGVVCDACMRWHVCAHGRWRLWSVGIIRNVHV